MAINRAGSESRFKRGGLHRELLTGLAVAASTLTPSPDVHAGVVYSGLVNLQASVGGKGVMPIGIPDLPVDAGVRIRFYGIGSAPEPFGAYIQADGTGVVEFAGDGDLARLAPASVIDTGLDFTPGPADFFQQRLSSGKAGTPLISGNWRYGDLAFFGFRINDTAAAVSYYGWGRFRLGEDLGSTYLVDS